MAHEKAFVVAGAGIAGLTVALALARHGFRVRIHEREPELKEVGAGLQLSPNATRILERLGILDALAATAVQPQAVVLKRAVNLKTVTRLPLGTAAEARWGAPYLVAHRADLQSALLSRVREEKASIELLTGTTVEAADFSDGVWAMASHGGAIEDVRDTALIAADGVWSRLRGLVGTTMQSRFTGYLAFRATLTGADAEDLAAAMPTDQVTAFMHPQFHLVAYPIRGGSALNLVAITRGEAADATWEQNTAVRPLKTALGMAHPALARLADDVPAWTAWPIHEADATAPWTSAKGLALIGDAAHAIPPFAAQGAAMAIEDAAVLAGFLARKSDVAAALADYERVRKPRVLRVARRGAFNRFVWHASGPVALARDAVLRARSADALMADFDWLYGYDAETDTSLVAG